jgi:hypothetical protein
MSSSDDNYVGLLLEQIRDQNKAVLEYVAEMPKVVARLDHIEQDVAELKQDMKVVKAAVTVTKHDLKQHKSLPARVAHGHA